MEPPHNLPDSAALQGLMAEFDKTLAGLPEAQERLMSLTGVAWSDDGLVKAVVGPRGQLIDLDIDPRVFRKPDAQALKASIMRATLAAIRQVSEQTQEIVYGQLPPELAELRAQLYPDTSDPMGEMMLTDAEIVAKRRGAGD